MNRLRGIFSIDADDYLGRAAEVTVEELGRRLWSVAAGSYRTVFAEGASSVVAVNTLGTPAAARAYREAVARMVPGKPIGDLVVTIDHLDHAGYGAMLDPEGEVVGHELTAAVVAGRGADGQLPVTRTVRGRGEALDADGVALELHYPGPLQGAGGLAVRFPEQGVLFVCGPQANARYGLFPDFHVEQYPSSLRRLLELDWHTLVAGRYGPMSRAEATRALGYFEALQTAAQQAFAAGVQIWLIDEMRRFCADSLRAEWSDLDGFEEHVGPGAVRLVHHYLMGGWGLEDTQEPELVIRELG